MTETNPFVVAARMAKAFNDDTFQCPNCNHVFSLSDDEVCEHVVSYWGEDLHEFECGDCGTPFFVKETVLRSFETALMRGDLE